MNPAVESIPLLVSAVIAAGWTVWSAVRALRVAQRQVLVRKFILRAELVSTRCYYSAWQEGLEMALWKAPCKFGCDFITAAEGAEFRRLGRKMGGWVVWNERSGQPEWVPFGRWMREVSRR